MNKKLLFLFVAILHCCCVLNAQDGSCYSYTRNQGVSFYNKGDYNGAKIRFMGAKECPDIPANHDLDTWIKKCDSALAEQKRENDRQRAENLRNEQERKYASSGYMSIDKIVIKCKTASNANSANIEEANVKASDITYLYPYVYYSGMASQSKQISLDVKLIRPNGTVVRGKSSPEGYSYSENKTVFPGANNYLSLSGWGSESGGTYTDGTYRIELWYKGNKLYQQSFVLKNTVETTYLLVDNLTSVSTSFSSTGGRKTFNVTTDGDSWDTWGVPSFCTVTGRTATSFTLECRSNTTDGARNDYMKIQSGNKEVRINITQEKSYSRSSSSYSYSSKPKANPVTWGMKAGMTAATVGTSFGECNGSIFNYGYGEDKEKPSYQMGVGYTAGLFFDVRLANMFYIQPGLYFSNHRFTNKFANSYNETISGTPSTEGLVYDDFTEKYSMSYLELPILFCLRFSFGRHSSLDISAGPYLACGLAGTCKLSGTMDAPSLAGSDGNTYFWHADVTGKANLFKTGGSVTEQYTTGAANTYNSEFKNTAAPYKRFDAGLSFGLTYEFAWVSLGVSYDLGLVNYANKAFFETERLQLSDYKGAVLTGYKQRNHSLQVTLGFRFNKKKK